MEDIFKNNIKKERKEEKDLGRKIERNNFFR